MKGLQGPTAERLRLAAEAIRLRNEEGLTAREIGERLGVSTSYANALYTDPDGAKARERKDRYAGRCEVCGACTSGSNGRAAAPTICSACESQRRDEERVWDREAVIAAIQAWAKEYGRPPSASDWRSAGVTPGGVRYPNVSLVYNTYGGRRPPFSSWADGIEAAGFPRPRIGHYPRTEEVRERMSIGQRRRQERERRRTGKVSA